MFFIFFFFWEKSKNLFLKVPFATNIISLLFREPQTSRSCMRAWPHFRWFCDSSIKTALFRSNWEYLGTPASLDLSFGNRYWFSCLWLLRPRVSPLAPHLAACWASEAEDAEVTAVTYFRSDSMLSLLTGAGVSRVQDWSKDLKTQKHCSWAGAVYGDEDGKKCYQFVCAPRKDFRLLHCKMSFVPKFSSQLLDWFHPYLGSEGFKRKIPFFLQSPSHSNFFPLTAVKTHL